MTFFYEIWNKRHEYGLLNEKQTRAQLKQHMGERHFKRQKLFSLPTCRLIQQVLVNSNVAQLNHRVTVDEILLCQQEWLWSYYYSEIISFSTISPNLSLNSYKGLSKCCDSFDLSGRREPLELSVVRCSVAPQTKSQNTVSGLICTLHWTVTNWKMKHSKAQEYWTGKHIFKRLIASTARLKLIHSLCFCTWPPIHGLQSRHITLVSCETYSIILLSKITEPNDYK